MGASSIGHVTKSFAVSYPIHAYSPPVQGNNLSKSSVQSNSFIAFGVPKCLSCYVYHNWSNDAMPAKMSLNATAKICHQERVWFMIRYLDKLASASIVCHLMALAIDCCGFRSWEVSEGCSGIESSSKPVLQSQWLRYNMAMNYCHGCVVFLSFRAYQISSWISVNRLPTQHNIACLILRRSYN